MKRHMKSGGWILLEAIFAVACSAFVVNALQRQQFQLAQQLAELKSEHQLQAQQALHTQMTALFGELSSGQSNISLPPSCQVCTGAQLQELLRYELSKW